MANPRKLGPQSIESHLDEERREVLALLSQGPRSTAPSLSDRSSSPYLTTRSPARSMLEIGEDGAMRSPTRQPPVRSMLDIGDDPAPATSRPSSSAIQSGPNSPVLDQASLAPRSHHPRSLSDHSVRPFESAARPGLPKVANRASDPYGFGLITSHSMPTASHRSTRRTPIDPALSGVRANEDGEPILDRDRQQSIPTLTLGSSRSPAGRMNARSRSPFSNIGVSQASPSLGIAVLDDGRKVDINNAYRRLSDANLAISGGSLSQLAYRKRTDDLSGRLTKDWINEDTENDDSSDDADSDTERRGRSKAARKSSTSSQAQTLLGAMEEERLAVAQEVKPQYVYKSLLDEPAITVTNSVSDKKTPKVEIHPSTAYEVSGDVSGVDSDGAENVNDIQRAQKLSFAMTPIITRDDTPRAIRLIYRGEYQKIVEAAEEEHRPLRKYVVATDLSDESTHALEWAIGTVLRDGDTLVCIYCVDEETGIGTAPEGQVPDNAEALKKAAADIRDSLTLTDSKDPFPQILRAPPLADAPEKGGRAATTRPPNRDRTRAEEDRFRAVQAITDKVVKLLRKTRLQVRVTVEVLHCKNPRHLITEVIDLINPTLVILGSRGRSALKGVILGSFSNYLVTKSSAPVMVARKRLRKTKYKTKAQQQVNNLNGPTTKNLANAKID